MCRHPGVEAIDFCELDSMVCDVAKQFFGESTATCFGDKRCKLVRRFSGGGGTLAALLFLFACES